MTFGLWQNISCHGHSLDYTTISVFPSRKFSDLEKNGIHCPQCRRSVYCNIIIYTGDDTRWANAIKKVYEKTHKHSIGSLQGGYQLQIYKTDSTGRFLSVGVFTNSMKLMIQPGQRGENDLLKFLRSYQDMLILTNSESDLDSDSEKNESDSDPDSEKSDDSTDERLLNCV